MSLFARLYFSSLRTCLPLTHQSRKRRRLDRRSIQRSAYRNGLVHEIRRGCALRLLLSSHSFVLRASLSALGFATNSLPSVFSCLCLRCFRHCAVLRAVPQYRWRCARYCRRAYCCGSLARRVCQVALLCEVDCAFALPHFLGEGKVVLALCFSGFALVLALDHFCLLRELPCTHGLVLLVGSFLEVLLMTDCLQGFL